MKIKYIKVPTASKLLGREDIYLFSVLNIGKLRF